MSARGYLKELHDAPFSIMLDRETVPVNYPGGTMDLRLDRVIGYVSHQLGRRAYNQADARACEAQGTLQATGLELSHEKATRLADAISTIALRESSVPGLRAWDIAPYVQDGFRRSAVGASTPVAPTALQPSRAYVAASFGTGRCDAKRQTPNPPGIVQVHYEQMLFSHPEISLMGTSEPHMALAGMPDGQLYYGAAADFLAASQQQVLSHITWV